MRAALALAVVLAMGLHTAGEASATDWQEMGRLHAKKAANLAAGGKCRSAIPEFTRAYQLLRDPALLFNRAECFRKMGASRRAVADYRQFLVELPQAPNRRLVEARLTALDPTYVPVPPPPEPAPIIAAAPPLPTGKVGDPEVPPASVKPGDPNPGAKQPDVPLPPPSEGSGGPATVDPFAPAEGGAPAASVPLPVDHPAPLGLGERPPPEPDQPPRSHVSPWIWVGASALLIAAGAGGAWLSFGRQRTDLPPSTLGNYRF